MEKRKSKIVQLRIIIRDAKGNRHTRLIDEIKLNQIQDATTEAGGDFFALLIEQSYASKIISDEN